MFEGQPKGLYALALANTGERFGYYTMLAIFTLYLQAKFGFSIDETSTIFSGFLAFVYFMPLIGGFLADRFGYGKMVTSGIGVMFLGYVLLAVPIISSEVAKTMMFVALSLIAIGTGLFKGNLQVMVGNLYNTQQYSSKRDTAFSLFYMAINVGALFAPTAATKVTNWVLGGAGLTYDGKIPELAHQLLNGTINETNLEAFKSLAAVQGFTGGDLATFATNYINTLSQAYNYGFAVACFSLVVSIAIYFGFRSTFKHADYNAKSGKPKDVIEDTLTPEETKKRIVALFLVFAVVVFFWMAFHQNGLTLTFFARDYTQSSSSGFMSLGFNVWNLVLVLVFIYAAFSVFQSKVMKSKIISSLVVVAAILGLAYQYYDLPASTPVLPQIFQQFNPFFVVALTPVSLAFFAMLAKKGKEPSAPRKIGLGMLIAALGYIVMVVGSQGLPTPDELTAGSPVNLVSPNWLINTYLVLTFAELLLSPMGISFVSRVAPPKYKGTMMGGWFVATALGNYLVAIPGYLWGPLPLWIVWTVLVVLCVLSAFFIFSMMKRFESVS